MVVDPLGNQVGGKNVPANVGSATPEVTPVNPAPLGVGGLALLETPALQVALVAVHNGQVCDGILARRPHSLAQLLALGLGVEVGIGPANVVLDAVRLARRSARRRDGAALGEHAVVHAAQQWRLRLLQPVVGGRRLPIRRVGQLLLVVPAAAFAQRRHDAHQRRRLRQHRFFRLAGHAQCLRLRVANEGGRA
eukprot:Gregarina_sp_Pseudo_9__156@NODE_1104_length_1874_cov_33_728065_g1032_i0_p5_GENE_NODE_1104_length_1874_cov_33_728065_g1032_i0NODE_1104_length_1874_cov_33_728065_g1032_i0_p5_ORF_typecomplete_len193_score12_14PAP_PilO/PF06864_12/0_0066_NODE_1104_length_1874_cov_33_728065_g1032_i0278856